MKFIYDDQGRLSEITFAENDNQEAICKMIENMQKNVCDTQKIYHDKYFEVQKNYTDKNFEYQNTYLNRSTMLFGNFPQIPMQ